MIKIPEYFKSEWHMVALSSDVKMNKAIARKIIGVPITVFRTKEGLVALYDRCPHRNYPLSKGRVVQNSIECPYHGWRFKANGQCMDVPGCSLSDLSDKKKDQLKVQTIKITEKHGGIFVRLSEDGPETPKLPPLMGDKKYDHFWWQQGVWKGNAFDAIENVLDPFHTKFIHNGFIRKRDKHVPVNLLVNSYKRSIEMVIEQKQPDLGLMSRALERGGRKQSFTRYYPPTTVQAQWQGEEKLTLCVTAFFPPEDETSFRPFACFTTPKGLAPSWLKQMAIRLFLFPVVAQDRRALEEQYEIAQSFGAPRYTQGPGDILGSRVYKLYIGKKLEPGQDEPMATEL